MYETLILNKTGTIAMLAKIDHQKILVRLDLRNYPEDKINFLGIMPEFNFHKDEATLEENWKETIETSEKNGWVILHGRNFG